MPPTAGDGGQAAGFAPAAAGSGSGGELLARWRENLAVLAANAAPGAERAVGRLGHRLACERGEVGRARSPCSGFVGAQQQWSCMTVHTCFRAVFMLSTLFILTLSILFPLILAQQQ